ncbi:uncharacterized protein LOC134265941 [Saccostrea cucullata]|uniref:uncharacterized protein LOC134261846 n=1 Tax=Saccostrea cuccullata TaxID=36930 RepID=UPI002ED3D75A
MAGWTCIKCTILVALISSVKAEECAVKVEQIVRREEPFFNRTNYRERCKLPIDGFTEKRAQCNGYFLHPKCICSFYMYELGIKDVCDLSDPKKNGSLDHVTVDFCREYSFTKNGPCQNNGTLIPSSDLASLDAKCECKENYKGEFCDEYYGKIKCRDTNPGVKSPPGCDEKGFNGRYCVLKIQGVSFWCDSESPVSDNMEDCSVQRHQATNEKMHGSSGTTSMKAATFLVFVTLLQML